MHCNTWENTILTPLASHAAQASAAYRSVLKELFVPSTAASNLCFIMVSFQLQSCTVPHLDKRVAFVHFFVARDRGANARNPHSAASGKVSAGA